MLYWLMFSFLFVTSLYPRSKLNEKLVFILFTLIAGFIAPNISQDYYNYLNGYYLSSPDLFPEPFSKLIFRVTSTLDIPITISFFIFACISMYYKRKAVLKLEIPLVLFFLVYFSKLFLLLDLTQVRAGAAVAICLLAFFEYISKNNKLCLLYIFIGFLFHYSAIMFVVIFALNRNKPKCVIWVLMSLVAIALTAVELTPILNSILQMFNAPVNYMVYLEEQSLIKVNPFSILSIFNLLLFIAFSGYKCLFRDFVSNVAYKLYAISIISFYLFINFPVLSFRISEFFLIYQVVLLVKCYDCVMPTQKTLYILLLALYSAFQLLMTFNVARIIMPYEMAW